MLSLNFGPGCTVTYENLNGQSVVGKSGCGRVRELSITEFK